jgi:GntP family gluconate:H+ symporter
MAIELVFVIGMVVLLFLALKVKANAFMALIATALVMGILSGMPLTQVIGEITTGFSNTVKSIGIVIIFGVMLGNYLDVGKGTNRMALDVVRLVGQKRSSLAMAISGYIVSIPVFSDAGFVILSPLVKAISKKAKIPLAILAVSLSAGLLATHVYVPPTPGPLAAAGLLGIDIGRAILYGGFAAIFMAAAGWIFAEIYFRNKPESFYTYREDAEPQKEVDIEDNDMPGSFASVLPLLLPMILIIFNTTCAMILPKESPVRAFTSFIGDANIALLIGVLLAIATMGKRLGGKAVMRVMETSLKDAGPIVFITAAGGALGRILSVSGAGDSMAQVIINTGLPFILVPFVIAAVLKIVQGSGTVAVVTAATLSAPIATQLGIDPILIFLASGAGARSLCHVNDSYFWVYTNCMGFDMKTGLRTLSVSNIFMALGGLLATFIVSLWI